MIRLPPPLLVSLRGFPIKTIRNLKKESCMANLQGKSDVVLFFTQPWEVHAAASVGKQACEAAFLTGTLN